MIRETTDANRSVALLTGLALAAAAGVAITVHPTATILALAVVSIGALIVLAPSTCFPITTILLSFPLSGWGASLGADLRTRTIICLAIALVGATAALRFNTAPPVNTRVVVVLAALFLFIGYQAATTSDYSNQIGARLLTFVTAALVAFSIWASHRSQPKMVALATTFTVAFLCGEAILGIVQFAAGQLVFMGQALPAASITEATNIPGFVRGIGTFYHANSLALSLVLGLVMALASLTSQYRAQRLVGLIALPVLSLGIVASLSRAGVLALVLVALGYGMLRFGHRRETIVVGIVIVATVAAFFVVPGLQSALDRFDPTAASTRDAGSNAARLSNLDGAIGAFVQRPLTGWGFGTSSLVDVQYGGNTNLGSGNEYLEVLQGGGIILAVIFILLVGVAAPPFRAALVMRSPLALYALILPLYALVESILQGDFLVIIAAGLVLTSIAISQANVDSPTSNH